MHAICHTDPAKPSRTLVSKIVNPKTAVFSSLPTQWGQQNENTARAAYFQMVCENHQKLTIRSSGFSVPPEHPFIGASPDAVVSCACHGSGCVEIKCPYSHRYQTIEQALADKQFCLEREGGNFALKKTHPYYSQVQTQLHVTGSAYCDFVVWTTVDMAVVRVLPDKPFLETCLSKASKFFRLAVLPELVTRKSEQKPENVNPEQGATTADFCSDLQVTGSRKTANLKKCDASTSRKRDLSLSPLKQSNHDRDLFCFCRKPEFGQMIACDSDECKYMWFHFDCVNVSKKGVPKGKWFCPACAHAKQKKLKT
jgi:hypothetical protein